MTAMNSNRRTGRRYDREFKNNAVALVQSGRTVTEVARDLGVSKWSLGHWAREARNGRLERAHGPQGRQRRTRDHRHATPTGRKAAGHQGRYLLP